LLALHQLRLKESITRARSSNLHDEALCTAFLRSRAHWIVHTEYRTNGIIEMRAKWRQLVVRHQRLVRLQRLVGKNRVSIEQIRIANK
jgi:hypothetical protein